ncbi:vitamin K epoxide reductase [Fibrisoma montanum]|uniref:Vitamin K epoxide reductase n=1 Tax=Fibrisoma montanum TaxID=2305895 RepID=A0A418M8I3_9BACT|nr:SPW repeat protein [Fibrisoma montanum]RIV22405.1 vitamin K epoxide reductase [Fibrisoma montanum]
MLPRILNALLGLWLIVSPAVLQVDTNIADNAHIVGPIIVTVSVIAISDSVRNVRLVNTLCGGWLLIAPWVMGYNNLPATINDLVVGSLTIGLSLVRGHVGHQFGGGWRSLFQDDPDHSRQASQR